MLDKLIIELVEHMAGLLNAWDKLALSQSCRRFRPLVSQYRWWWWPRSYVDYLASLAYHGALDQLKRSSLPMSPVLAFEIIQHRAAWGNRRDVLAWCEAVGTIDRSTVCAGAACGGHIQLLVDYARASEDSEVVCNEAAKHGQLAVLQWARGEVPAGPATYAKCIGAPVPWSEKTACLAFQFGHANILYWSGSADRVHGKMPLPRVLPAMKPESMSLAHKRCLEDGGVFIGRD